MLVHWGKLIILTVLPFATPACGQTHCSLFQEIHERTRGFWDLLTLTGDLGNGYRMEVDTSHCIPNARETGYGLRSLILDSMGARVGEIERWSNYRKIPLESIRIDSMAAAFSGSKGRYFCGVVEADYNPCVVENLTTGNDLRHWRLRNIYELRDPYTGNVREGYAMANGTGFIITSDTIGWPDKKLLLEYKYGIWNGFVYTKYNYHRGGGGEYELESIAEFRNARQLGLYVAPSVNHQWIVGFQTQAPDPEQLHRREYLVDKRGRATGYREYDDNMFKPDFTDLNSAGKQPLRVCLCDPGSLASIFGETSSLYPHEWQPFAGDHLGCKTRR